MRIPATTSSGIGGGSALDSAKAIAAMSVLGGNIADYMGKEIDGEFPPMVLIPTTAGTGSEATKFTIITDTEKDIKMLLKGDKLLPDLAVLDYSYTLSAPKSVTAATGMDALTHAIESYTSRKANPITDTFALSALKRIFANLPTAYSEPENEIRPGTDAPCGIRGGGMYQQRLRHHRTWNEPPHRSAVPCSARDIQRYAGYKVPGICGSRALPGSSQRLPGRSAYPGSADDSAAAQDFLGGA